MLNSHLRKTMNTALKSHFLSNKSIFIVSFRYSYNVTKPAHNAKIKIILYSLFKIKKISVDNRNVKCTDYYSCFYYFNFLITFNV